MQWIHDNIEAFGGDPGNVTIVGQSGGGGKVANLMSMPMVKGNVHKAIIQSGGFRGATPEEGAAMTKQFLDFLGIDKTNIDKLWDYTPQELIKKQREINATRTVGTYFVCPVVMDGRVVKYDPFDGAEGSEFCKDITLITGYDKDDAVLTALMDPKMFKWTEEDVKNAIKNLGFDDAQADDIIRIYKGYIGEDAQPVHIFTTFLNDRNHTKATYTRAHSRELVGGGAPVYSYCFMREGNDPEFRAVHGVEIPFFFGNADYAPALWNCDTHYDAMKLNVAARSAWAAFARTGNPSNPYMPVWRPYDSETRYTMCVDIESKLVSKYHEKAYDYVF